VKVDIAYRCRQYRCRSILILNISHRPVTNTSCSFSTANGGVAIACEVMRKVSESVNPMSANNVQFSRAIPRSKSAECSLDADSHVARRPTTPITYTNLLNWRRGKPEVYVINDGGDIPAEHVTRDVRRSSSGSKKSSGHARGKMATSDETLTSFDHSSSVAAGDLHSHIIALRQEPLYYPKLPTIPSPFRKSGLVVKVKVKKVNLYRALLCPVSKALRYGPYVTRGSHSFTGHPTRTISAFTPQL